MTAAKAIPLCRLDDIPDPGSRGFTVETGGEKREIFVVRRGGRVYGYVNSCPHTGVNLEWIPDEFLTEDQTLIICSTHGAEFRIEDGYCVAGPCMGDSLAIAKLEIDKGTILLDAGD
jgi:nitrite reductase/ring-hydroxylating ferredoxin subunit